MSIDFFFFSVMIINVDLIFVKIFDVYIRMMGLINLFL